MLVRRDALLWLEDAGETLQDASTNLVNRRYHVAVERAILAVEKAFKALILAGGRTPAKTHNLRLLYRDARKRFDLPAYDEEKLGLMSAHYLPSRYSNATGILPSQAFGRGIARDYVALARQVVTDAGKVLRE